MSLPSQLAGLLHPGAYPHPVESVILVETHVSWVLLTGEIAYKIKRPVRFRFIDLSSPQRRAYFCHEELRLNRRFAPRLYLDVCEIKSSGGDAHVDGSGETIEHAVRMRQFQRSEELDELLARDAVTPEELTVFGRTIAAIHAAAPVAEPHAPWCDPQATRVSILQNLEECAQAATVFERASDELRALQFDLESRLESAAWLMNERRARGRVRECHGDLHCANIVRDQGQLVAFDCMEFQPAFRWIDVAEDVAFLWADLLSRNCPRHAQAFLAGYLAATGDYQACRMLPVYGVHRALVRAKVAALGGQQAQFQSYLECARGLLRSDRPILILMSGLSGSGKTWLAERLAPVLGAVHLRSDMERKRLAGLDELSRSGSAVGEGIYSRDFTMRVDERLSEAAENALSGGLTVIVDGTFARGADRTIFRMLARRAGVTACLVHCRAPHEVLLNRIVQRQLQARDASEADIAVLDWQKEHWEPIGSEEGWFLVELDTGHADLDDLVKRIAALRALPAPE
jgi:uncharacterized protein